MKDVAITILISLACISVIFSAIWIIESQNSSQGYSIKDDLIEQISERVPEYTKIDSISMDFKHALISAEDKRFYWHCGFDVVGIGRAVIVNIKAGSKKQGGSTLTQQLAKNLFLSGEKTYIRKVKEAVFAITLEAMYTKDEILEMYMNLAYYGSGAYGIQNASKVYFNKSANQLTLEESAMLAGVLIAPSKLNPKVNYDKARVRQGRVLELMERNGFIDKNEKEQARNKQLCIAVK